MLSILTYWKEILTAVCLTAFAGTVLYKNNRIDLLTTNLAASVQTVATLKASLDKQNQAINGLKTAAEVQQAKHAEALAKAQIAQNQANLQANRLLNIAAQPDKSACENANDLFDQMLSK
jgi:hypothetical protein